MRLLLGLLLLTHDRIRAALASLRLGRRIDNLRSFPWSSQCLSHMQQLRRVSLVRGDGQPSKSGPIDHFVCSPWCTSAAPGSREQRRLFLSLSMPFFFLCFIQPPGAERHGARQSLDITPVSPPTHLARRALAASASPCRPTRPTRGSFTSAATAPRTCRWASFSA
jgi:hypothetical protein